MVKISVLAMVIHILARMTDIIWHGLPTLFKICEQSAMDRFDSMRLFTRVVERRSFTAAAA
ncbi:hypothetical protein, partial [Mesorhizobium sp.]|uniref:hypothetical protein n=1 Tax=Mesorhizobium sp. TaxID=1871066 RepID=UPI000FE7C409